MNFHLEYLLIRMLDETPHQPQSRQPVLLKYCYNLKIVFINIIAVLAAVERLCRRKGNMLMKFCSHLL
jgi:hypothetical protein